MSPGLCVRRGNDGERNDGNGIEPQEDSREGNSVKQITPTLSGSQVAMANVPTTTKVREGNENDEGGEEGLGDGGDIGAEIGKVIGKEAQKVAMDDLEDENIVIDSHGLVNNGLEIAKDPRPIWEIQHQLEGGNKGIEDSSIEAVHNTPQPHTQDSSCLDPIPSVECANNNGHNLGINSMRVSSSLPQKRPRGRPKRTTHSLPDPVFVPSTPSKADLEAMETWNTAKSLGVKSSNEKAVISALRRSKRLLVLEESNQLG